VKTSIRILLAIISLGIAAACNAVRPLTILATDEPPGVGEKADKGYAACEPVIAALEAFRAAHGAYPEQLAELVPEYVPDAPVKTDDLDFSYSSTGDTYSLSFHYLGPGMNTCTYKPAAGWHCSGAF
jgi:hypothetical protein